MSSKRGRAVLRLLRRLHPARDADRPGGGGEGDPAGDPRGDGREQPGAVPPTYDSYTEYALRTGGSPEEYVTTLLAANGGAMRQKHIVETADWAASSTSNYLSNLEEDGRIVRLRVGRENLVYLPERAPEGVDAPA